MYNSESSNTCAFTDCSSGTNCGNNPAESYQAVSYLCQQQIIKGFPTSRVFSVSEGGPTNIQRIDLAKVALLSLLNYDQRVTFASNPATPTFSAENFPVPFVDLQKGNADADSVRYAKILSYLEYGDGRSPFDRNQLHFNSNGPIDRALVLKVLLEAWNIDETAASGDSPFTDVPTSHPYFKYVKRAHELGLVAGSGLFRPDEACSREEAFLFVYRLMNSSTVSKPTLAQINTGFFVPGQHRPDNLALGVGTDRGNFNHYTKTSFALDGVVPLVFAHGYNSYVTELPAQLFPSYLGRGWSHSFNCYVTTLGSGANQRLVVHYPDGKLHFYKPSGSSLVPESIGVFDAVTTTATSVTITTPAKLVYLFEKIPGQADNYWLIKSIKDRNNNTLTFTNELGADNNVRLKSVADPAGRTLNFVYKPTENWLTEVVLSGVGEFNGRKITFDYHPVPADGDSLPDLKEYREPDLTGALKTTTYAYLPYTDSTAHLLKTITLPKGNVIDNTYQQRKLRSSQTLNGGGVVQSMNTNWKPDYNFDSQGSTGEVSVTGNVTKKTSFTHNTNALATRMKTSGEKPVDLAMHYGFASDRSLATRLTQNPESPDSTSVRIEYEEAAPHNVKLVETLKAPGQFITQKYTYTEYNDVKEFTNGRGFTTVFDYDNAGNLKQINHPIGAPTKMVRNGRGLIEQLTTPAGIVTTFGYNTYGNLLNTSTANAPEPAIVTSATYDDLSRVKSKTDARGHSVTYDYFANDLLKKLNAPLGYTVQYGYDPNDNSTSVTNAKGHPTTMVYDQHTDQLKSRTFGSKTETFDYYEDGSLKTFTNGRGNVFSFSYDPSGRLISDGYATNDFNADGTLNTVTHAQGTKTYVLDYDYDLLKRVSKTTCDGFAVQYRYDNNNNLEQVIYPGGSKTVTYGYDEKDRLKTVTDWAERVTTYDYDDDGKLRSYTLPNGTKALYTYDAAGRPTGLRHQKADQTAICAYTFTLDPAGNHTGEEVTEPFASVPTLPTGTTTYTVDDRNQTKAAGSLSYDFDNNGAMNDQAGLTLTWDSKDNLLTRNGVTYFYDGNETRRAKTGRRYVLNELSNSVLAETDEAGNYLYFYVHGPSGLLYRQSAGGAVEFYHYDFRGSTVAMTDASQNTVRQYQYDAYGQILQQTPVAASDDNPFRYVGQHGVQYEAPNLYFMRARYYDPSTGKFLSEDPIWSTNLYGYADGNPVTRVDADGKLWILAGAAIGGLVSGGFELYEQLDAGGELDWKKIGYEAGKGALVGGVAMVNPGAAIAIGASFKYIEVSTENYTKIPDEKSTLKGFTSGLKDGIVSIVLGGVIGAIQNTNIYNGANNAMLKQANKIGNTIAGNAGDALIKLSTKDGRLIKELSKVYIENIVDNLTHDGVVQKITELEQLLRFR